MQSIYVNNFRGFAETTIPLHRVNFFVGENSTGKTSLLALLDLLASPNFWFFLDFNGGDYEFGGYRDIVSVISPDQSEFQVGVYRYEDDNPEHSACYLLHFRQSKDGLPELARFSQLCSRYYATVRISTKQIAAYVSADVPIEMNCNSAPECFSFLQGLPTRIRLGYKVLPTRIGRFVRMAPIPRIPEVFDLFSRDLGFDEPLASFPYPGLGTDFASMAPIRTKPKRTYDGYTKTFSPEGEHTPYVIRKRLPRGSRTNEFKKALQAFGEDSGLFESVGVTQFGKDSAAPFELTITLSAKALRLNSVGYGVSQALPIIVELLTHGKNSWLAIQQPEVHLHPRAQAALGEALFHAATETSNTLFVETHSDHLIDRYRIKLREKGQETATTQVVFFERSGSGNCAYPMLLDDSGEYPEDQPAGFRSFFLREQKRILGL